MSPSKKVWVIEPEPKVRTKRPSSPGSAGGTTLTANPLPGSRVGPVAEHGRSGSKGGGGAASPSVLHVVAAYVLGSAAPFLVQQSPHGGMWATVSIVSFAIWSLVLSQWELVQAAFTHGWLPFHVWLVGMCLASLAGITSWSRAILLVGREFSNGLPHGSRWFRGSRMVGLLGLAVPGLGLMLVGRSRRAAGAFWVSGMLILSVLVLWQAKVLWQAHQQAASAGFDSLGLERMLVACMITTLLGSLAWIVNAYDGARLANRIPLRASMQGPWWAVALLLSAAAFFATFEPAQRAQDLDKVATSLRGVGFRYIPLQVQLASLRLDPSNLIYRVQVAELYEELGREVDAARMRDDVLSRWDTYSERLHDGRQAELTAVDVPPQDPFQGYRPVRFLLPIQP